MSKEEPAEEWKTIRIPASAYYRVAELSGIFTALFGAKVPMSVVASWAILIYHDETFPKVRKILLNPEAIEEFRKEVGGRIKRVSEVISRPKYE